jgi:ATP-dependent RNA helicase DDX54/DBP10
MRRLAPSPTPSENEADIGEALYTDEPQDNDGWNGIASSGGNISFDVEDLLGRGQNSDHDDDEAFIALQQAASFRKASNLKGKSVKKGGGFQAMGMSTPYNAP